MSPEVLRGFLGSPNGARWKRLLAAAGVDLEWEPLVPKGTRGLSKHGVGRYRKPLTFEECRRVMEVCYREVGEFRMKRWAAR